MIQLIRFYLRSAGPILPILLLGSLFINLISFAFAWLLQKPTIYFTLSLSTAIVIVCLFVIAIRLNLKDLQLNSFTIAGMLPVSQGKLLGAKLLTGCGIIFVGAFMQVMLTVGLIFMSGQTGITNFFEDSLIIIEKNNPENDERIIQVLDTKEDENISIQIGKDNGEVLVTITGNITIDEQKTEVTLRYQKHEIAIAILCVLLAMPFLFLMIVCFIIYPFVWARCFVKKEFLSKVLGIAFILGISGFQGTMIDWTESLLAISLESDAEKVSWIWNLVICSASYLVTAQIRDKKMDLL